MMEHTDYTPHPFEPSQNELPPMPDHHFWLDRRKFFQLFGGGIAVAFLLQDMLSIAGEIAPSEVSRVPADQVGAWIHIGEDGIVKVYTGKVEVGQNIRTSLSQIVAEELYVPIASIHMIMGDTDLVPYDAGTFGSRTTPQMGTQLRKAAATLRLALLDMAAKNWNVDAKSLKADGGIITDSQTNSKITYSSLTKGQQLLVPVADDVEVIPAGNWKVAGKTVTKVNGKSFITGRHQYVSDMKLPGMLYGKVLRAPSYGARLVEVDVSGAESMPGVIVVRDGQFVGVVAPNQRTANKALQAVKVKWEETTDHPSNAVIFDHLVQHASGGGGRGNTKGNVEDGLKAAGFTHSNKYNIHYIAHVPLEPRAAVAEWKEGKLTVWTGTQRPFGVQENLAETFRISKEKVRVIMPDTGSGYGGKHTGEAAIEAARLAQEAKKPVKLVWTREEEFTWAYFRPAGVIEVSSGVRKDGSITAWKFINYNSGPAGLGTQYKIEHQQIAHIPSETPLRQGSYRALASPANVFARECHITDLARLVKMDPFEFRMKNLDDDRLKAVLETAAKAFGWNDKKNKASGHGYGIACGFEKGGYVATCAEVNVNANKEVKIVRIVQAFECGAIVNPLHVESQVMGSIVQGLGGALFESINFSDGKIKNASLSAYRVPRFSDIPPIEIIIINRKDLPSAGAGEAAIIGVAPAIRNAILDATGLGLTTLPLLPANKLV
jgi:nicotinate dehydrogenase subunit B